MISLDERGVRVDKPHQLRVVAAAMTLLLAAVVSATPAGAADGAISGTITGADTGQPLADVQVCAVSVASSGSGCDTTGADGTYTIGSLPPRTDYRVRAFELSVTYTPEYYDDSVAAAGATLVTVADGATITDIDLELTLAGTISGRVTDTMGRPLEDITVCADSEQTESFGCTSTDADGEYTVRGLAAATDFSVGFSDPSGGYATETYDDVADLEDATLVSVASGADTPGIDADLEGAGSITGTVTDDNGPLGSVLVCAGQEGAAPDCATTDASGSYAITALPIGAVYTISFETDGFVKQYWQTSNSFDNATPVTVASGGPTTGIDAQLVPGGSMSGTVTTSTGDPFGDVTVCALSEAEDFRTCGITDGNGAYQLTDLAVADDYLVFFSVLGRTMIGQYYDGQVLPQHADLVEVAAGAETQNIDARIEPRRDFHLLDQACRVLSLGSISGGDSVEFAVAGSIPASQNPGTPNCSIPSDADAVLANVIVNDPSAAGNLRLTAAGTTPTGGIVNFSANGLDNSNAQNVPLSADQRLELSVNGGAAGNGQVLAAGADVEILGWWGPVSNPGTRYQPVTPCAFLDTRTNQGGTGVFAGPYAADTSLAPTIVGNFGLGQGGVNNGGGVTACDVPSSAAYALVNIVLINSTGEVGVTSPATNARIVNNIAHSPSMNNASAVVLPINADGTIDLDLVVESGDTNVRGVVLGYYSESLSITYVPVTPCATFDTRANQGAVGDFAGARLGDQETIYDVTGTFDVAQGGGNSDCGIPEGVLAIELNLVAINPVQPGNLRASALFTPPNGGVLNFANLAAPMNNSNAIVLGVSSTGQITVGVNGGPTGSGIPITDIRGVVTGYYVVP